MREHVLREAHARRVAVAGAEKVLAASPRVGFGQRFRLERTPREERKIRIVALDCPREGRGRPRFGELALLNQQIGARRRKSMNRRRARRGPRRDPTPSALHGYAGFFHGSSAKEVVRQVAVRRDVPLVPLDSSSQEADVPFELPFRIDDLLGRAEMDDVDVDARHVHPATPEPRRDVLVDRIHVRQPVGAAQQAWNELHLGLPLASSHHVFERGVDPRRVVQTNHAAIELGPGDAGS